MVPVFLFWQKGVVGVAQQNTFKKQNVCIENRMQLTATGVERVDFFSSELITAQTAEGKLHIKGEGLYIENLSAETGELLVKGKVLALSYAEGVRPAGFWGRLFK